MQPSQQPVPEPSVAGVRVRPVVPLVLYALLLLSAALAFWAQQRDDVSPGMKNASPWLFFAFAVGFAVYRLALVFARRYSPFKAFLQVTIAALFFMQLALTKPAAGVEALPPLLGDADPRVRAMAAELAGWRHELPSAPALVELLGDPSPAVRASAHQALVRLNDGADLGRDDAARSQWEARFPK